MYVTTWVIRLSIGHPHVQWNIGTKNFSCLSFVFFNCGGSKCFLASRKHFLGLHAWCPLNSSLLYCVSISEGSLSEFSLHHFKQTCFVFTWSTSFFCSRISLCICNSCLFLCSCNLCSFLAASLSLIACTCLSFSLSNLLSRLLSSSLCWSNNYNVDW